MLWKLSNNEMTFSMKLSCFRKISSRWTDTAHLGPQYICIDALQLLGYSQPKCSTYKRGTVRKYWANNSGEKLPNSLDCTLTNFVVILVCQYYFNDKINDYFQKYDPYSIFFWVFSEINIYGFTKMNYLWKKV